MIFLERLWAVAGTAVVVALAALPTAGATAPRPLSGASDVAAEDCSPAAPAAVEAQSGASVDVEILVLVDGIAPDDAKALVEQAAVSYRPAGVALLPKVRTLPLTSDGTLARAGSTRETLEAGRGLAEAKARFGGVRPAGSDAVVLVTSKDLFSTTGSARDYSPAGAADCVGGVRYANRAFAVIEALAPMSTSVAGIDMDADRSTKLFAHELGHLFGAEHHFANCAEAQPAEVLDPDPGHDGGLCTLMINDMALMSRHLSTVNTAIIRGHALSYADG